MTRSEAFPSEEIVILLCLVLTGIVMLSLGVYPGRYVEFDVLGSPLGIRLNGQWVIAGLLFAMVAAGMHRLVRDLSGRPHIAPWYSATFWILPGLVTLAAAGSVPRQFGDTGPWLGSLIFMGCLLAIVVVAECGTVRLDAPHYRTARLGLNIANYSTALALYVSIHAFQVRSLLSATAVILVTFPLALDLLRGTEEQLKTTWLYAAIIALVAGEVTWAINALGLRALFGGALILLTFYTLTGLTQQYLADRLTRSVALEFATIAMVAIAMILLGVRLTREAPLVSSEPPADSAFPAEGTDAMEFVLPIPDVPLVLDPPAPLMPPDTWLGTDTSVPGLTAPTSDWPLVLTRPSPLVPEERAPEGAP